MSKIDISLEMQHSKTTKGTEVYTCPIVGAPITSIYIKKDAIPANLPKVIYVTVESEEE